MQRGHDDGRGVVPSCPTMAFFLRSLLLATLALTAPAALGFRLRSSRSRDPKEADTDPNVVRATKQNENKFDGKPGWHTLVNPGDENGPEESEDTEAWVDRVCSGHAAMCRRFIYLSHGCFKGCESEFQAFYDAKTSDRPGDRLAVANWKQGQKETEKAWELCMAKCVPVPSCKKLCKHGDEYCEDHCLEEYRKQAQSFEALYFADGSEEQCVAMNAESAGTVCAEDQCTTLEGTSSLDAAGCTLCCPKGMTKDGEDGGACKGDGEETCALFGNDNMPRCKSVHPNSGQSMCRSETLKEKMAAEK